MNYSRQLFGLSVCAAGVLAFSAATALAQNILVDPSFEAAAYGQPNPIPVPGGVGGGWAAFQGNLTTDIPHTGLQSTTLWDNTWNPSGVYQIVNVTPGWTYTASAYFDNTGAASSWGTPYLINLEFHDSSGAQVGTTASTGWTAEVLGQWELLSTSGAAPVGAAYAYVYFMAMDGGTMTGTHYLVDDATLMVPEPGTLALLGLGLAGALIWRRR